MPQATNTIALRMATLATLASLLLGVTAAATSVVASTLDKQEALSIINRSLVSQNLDALNRAADRGALDLAGIKALITDSSMNAAEREYVLYETVYTLRQKLATPDTREIAEYLTTYENEIRVWHEEGPRAVPLFAIRTAARGTLNSWTSQETRDALLHQFNRGNFSGLMVFEQPLTATTRPVQAGAIAALHRADISALQNAGNWMLDQFSIATADVQDNPQSRAQKKVALYSVPMSVVAMRTRDIRLYTIILTQGNGPATIRLLRSVSDNLSTDDAFDILTIAIQRSDLASATLFQMGELIGRHPNARQQIISRLADAETGGTAAAVIARSNDIELLRQASVYMVDGGLTARRAVLALKLNNSDYARSLAKQRISFLSDAQLKSEVNSWLAQ